MGAINGILMGVYAVVRVKGTISAKNKHFSSDTNHQN